MAGDPSPQARGSAEAGASPAAGTGALELRGAAVGLLDEPLVLQVRGLGAHGATETLVWRARMRDDDSRVWRATASRAVGLADAWAPAKGGAGPLAALQSLRPVSLDVRVEAADGRSASRTFTRRLLGDGVRVRRWRDGVAATLFLPDASAAAAGASGAGGARTSASGAGGAESDEHAPAAAVVLDATIGPEAAAAVPLTAALLASRGVLALVVSPPRGSGDAPPAPQSLLATAAERLAQVPAAMRAPGGVQLLAGPQPVPPGVPAQLVDDAGARAAWWDALLARLGARPRLAQPPPASAASSTARPLGESS
jgi:hypothetical protein